MGKKMAWRTGRHQTQQCGEQKSFQCPHERLLSREDFNQLRSPTRKKRTVCDLAVELPRPASRKRRMASRAITFRRQTIFLDEVPISPDKRLAAMTAVR